MLDKKIVVQSMELEGRQKTQAMQRLMMSAHMQQAIQMLQIPLIELEGYIEAQIITNPLLDFVDTENRENEEIKEIEKEVEEEEKELSLDEKDLSILKQLDDEFYDLFAESGSLPIRRTQEEEKLKVFQENSVCAEIQLYEHLMKQAKESFQNEQDFHIAEILIGYVDSTGFLTTPLLEIAHLHQIEMRKLRDVLSEIQTFEPYGIGASTIRESLLIQLRCMNKQSSLAYQLIEDHYEDLLRNHIPAIQKKLGCSREVVCDEIEKVIAKLDLHPGALFSSSKAIAIVPDVSLRQEDQQLIVEVNRDYIPGMKLNRRYLKLLDDPQVSKETKQYIRHHFLSAKWLARNLQQRYSTIERIVQSLSEKQYQFFTEPDGKLVPLTMKELAEKLGVHESTIARTVANKYLYSPRGIIPLRDFFTGGYQSDSGEDLSSKTVQDRILFLIEHENKQHPYSDEEISRFLKKEGIHCARRTVTKYRANMKMGNALQRRKY